MEIRNSFINAQHMNDVERKMSVYYVLILFILIVFICCYIIYHSNTDMVSITRKQQAIYKMEKVENFQQVQTDHLADIDSVSNKIEKYNPGVIAQYEESDIRFLINNIRNVYDENRIDPRYKMFLHAADIYEMWLTDRKTLWGKQQNIQNFKAKLQDSDAGIKDIQDQIKPNN
jgi:hypothetical protein